MCGVEPSRQRVRREVEQAAKPNVISVRVLVIVFGIIRLPNELDFWERSAFGQTEVVIGRAGICFTRFLRNVDQIGRAQIPDLPLIGIIADARPVSIKPILRQLQVEILR